MVTLSEAKGLACAWLKARFFASLRMTGVGSWNAPARGGFYPLYRLSTRQAFWPPMPKEFDMQASTRWGRAWFGT